VFYMKKFVLAAMAAAAAASFSGSALAGLVDLSGVAPVPDTYASELVTAGTTVVSGTQVETDLGFGVSPTQTRFIRYDLTNATFAAGLTAANLTVAGVVAADIVLSSGGTAGSSTVIFQITAGAAGSPVDGAVRLALGAAPVGVVPTALAPIDVTYRLYETAAAAVAGGGHLAQDSGTIIRFATAVGLTATPNTNTANVEASPSYAKFLPAVPPGIPTTTLAEIGKVSLGTNGALKPDGFPVALTDILAAGTALTLTGTDLTAATAATGLSLIPVGGCVAGGGGIPVTSRTATTVSFGLPAPFALTDASLCFEVPAANTTPIAAQSFSADVAPVPAAGVPMPDVPAVTAGTFVRNGTILKAAFADTTNAAGVSMAAHMTNLGNVPAPYTVRCLLTTNSVAGTPGTIPASTARREGLTTGLGCPSNGTLRGLELTFAVPEGSVIGSIVRQNTSTGAASFDTMIGSK
jgi:hypothetical protein